MTRRFDRPDGGGKRHFASLFGLAHLAYAAPGATPLLCVAGRSAGLLRRWRNGDGANPAMAAFVR